MQTNPPATMIRRQAFKFRLQPTAAQAALFRQFAGTARYIWNKALAQQQVEHQAGKKFANYVAMAGWLTTWRNAEETAWLKSYPCDMERQALKDLERAFKNFFEKRGKFPRFKRKGDPARFRFPDRVEVDQEAGSVRLPKIGWVRYRNSREILGKPKNVTVSFEVGHWYVAVQTERTVEVPVHASTSMVGIDVGIVNFATLSDGSPPIPPCNALAKAQQRLARYQRAMSRKVKGSANWRKAKARVARIHRRVANTRTDFLHKTTTAICKTHAVVVVEDLQIRNMSASAAGTAEAPGRNVKAKSGLNRAILDQGWGEFRRQLSYKQEWLGGRVIAVPPRNTSRTCPCCGHVSAENRRTQAAFACVQCGFSANADLVGAINIRAAGDAVLACGGPAQSGRPMKQEHLTDRALGRGDDPTALRSFLHSTPTDRALGRGDDPTTRREVAESIDTDFTLPCSYTTNSTIHSIKDNHGPL